MNHPPFDLKRPIYQARVPSNIAFIKYWGKRAEAVQWPANDSLSMTLSDLCTLTKAQSLRGPDHLVFLNGQALHRDDKPAQKIYRHLDALQKATARSEPLLIDSHNTFPAGAGLASSASGLGALTLSALAAWLGTTDWQELAQQGFDQSTIAHWARRGSGSAGRSLFGGFVLWQAGDSPERQSISSVYPASHWPLLDIAVILQDTEKPVSSTDAHRLAWESPLFQPRLAGLPERMAAVQDALTARDLRRLGPLLETEALEMHSVIMTAQPPICYLTADTVSFLSYWRQWRQQHGVAAYITIDAGPNIHIIAEAHDRDRVLAGIRAWRETVRIMVDHVGTGPELSCFEEKEKP